MNEVPSTASAQQRNLLEKALLEIRKLKHQINEMEQREHEPIAIVGLSCRFPGGNTPEEFWQALCEGRDCITEMHQQRWNMDALYDSDPDVPGKIYTRALGIVQDPECFDAGFFGIAPREAEDIDPQHRVLLEVCHEALQRSGISVNSLANSATGVFVGISGQDYAHLGSRLGKAENITPWQGTGNALSAAAGRISYLFDLRGPSVSVDTACSSSLVALHLACQSLRSGESETALAGGVHLIFNPATTIIFAKARMLSPEGKCKTFDRDADGYVRSEGCGVLVLKRLSVAQRDRNNIIAVIRGSAINQDGKSQGFTAPNEQAQVSVIHSALANARLQPSQVAFLEAHGTGTPLGDPIELAAANNAYAEGRKTPLLVGACKTNIGHSEAAAGMAGVIKTAFSLQKNMLPPHLHFKTPNPYVAWGAMALEVNTRLQSFPEQYTHRYAAVSGFGFTGTNAHVVLAAPPVSPESVDECSWPKVFPVSAKSAEALSIIMHDLAIALEQPESDAKAFLKNVCFTLATGRDHYRHRAAFIADRKDSLNRALQSNAATKSSTEVAAEAPIELYFSRSDSLDIPWILNAWETMPLIHNRMEALNDEVFAVVGKSLLSLLETAKLQGELDTQAYRYIRICAQYAMGLAWLEMGVRPARLVGNGDGLLVAAAVARAISFHELLQIIKVGAETLKNPGYEHKLNAQAPRLSLYRLGNEARIVREIAQASFCAELLSENQIVAAHLPAETRYWSVAPLHQNGSDQTLWLEEMLARFYLHGADVRWEIPWKSIDARRVILPTYPLERHRYWNAALRDPALQNQSLKDAVSVDAKNWLYELIWENCELPMGEKRQGPWHIITDDIEAGEALATFLRSDAAEAKAWLVDISGEFPSLRCDGERYDSLDSILKRYTAASSGVCPQFILMPVKACSTLLINAEYQAWTRLVLGIAQQLKASGSQCFFVTMNAYAHEGNALVSPVAAMLAGFAKNLSVELGDIFNGHVDCNVGNIPLVKLLPKLALVLKKTTSFMSLSLDEKSLRQQHLQRLEEQSIPCGEFKAQTQRYYVIAGGTGAIGLAVARSLVSSGATHIALLSRSHRNADQVRALQQQTPQCKILTVMVDICDFDALSDVLQQLREELPLAGVIHAAGVFELSPVENLTAEKVFAVMGNKVKGICNLDLLTAHDDLTCFSAFSSIASVWGSAGNFHYCAANQVVDSVIQGRVARGLRGNVINWGPWQDSGMLSDSSSALAEQRGLRAMSKATAIELFERLLACTRVQTIVADLDWQRLYPLLALTPAAAMVQALAPKIALSEIVLDDEDLEFKAYWSSLERPMRRPALLSYLRQQLARSLHAEPESIDAQQPLINMGIDSLMAVGFRQRVQQVTGLEIPVVLVLGGASLDTLAERLSETFADVPVIADAQENMLEGVL